MDFGTLLHKAQKNSLDDKKSAESKKFYSTKFEAPKREKKDPKLSANIQKFLQKKEEEERQNAIQKKKDLEQLLAMRDTKAKNKIKKMLKVTKSANKSVLEDAVDADNTAYTLEGPEQPDEDDYGYVSQEASQFYKNLMDKYKTIPEEKKFSESRPQSKTDLLSTKDRVRAAIMKEQEEENMPHRRKRQAHSAHHDSIVKTESSILNEHHRTKKNLYDPELERQEEERKKKEEQRAKAKHRKPPPTLDFHQLLQLAEKKQYEPLEVEVEVKPKKDPNERLLTNKEKREWEERKAFLAEREKRKQAIAKGIPYEPPAPKESARMAPNGRIPKLGDATVQEPRKMEPNGRIPKLNSVAPASKPILAKTPDSKLPSKPSSSSHKNSPDVRKSSNDSKYSSESRKVTSSSMPPPSASKPRPSTSLAKPSQQYSSNQPSKLANEKLNSSAKPSSQAKPSVPNASRDYPPKNVVRKPTGSTGSSATSTSRPQDSVKSKPTDAKSRPLPLPVNGKKPATDIKPRQFPPADTKTRQFPPADVKTRQFPPADIKTRKFPPDDVKTRQFPPADVRGGVRPSGPVASRPGGATRQFPPPDVRRNGGPPPKKIMKKHVIADDDSEYDSEMDDFIDDEPEEGDYSKYIKEIFGYDKSKYRHIDEDVDNMESSFSQQMKEEYISKKIGIMEDLEDMRLEAEQKKKSKKRSRISDDDD